MSRADVEILTLNLMVMVLGSATPLHAQSVKLSEVRKLAQQPVATILEGVPVPRVEIDRYWESVRGRNKPLIVLFYSNEHTPSQRVATLIRHVSLEFADRIDFRRVEVTPRGSPNGEIAKDFKSRFSLDGTPGILFYDRVKGKLVLEDEDYVDPDFKEFRAPRMMLWNIYHQAVRRELNKLLAD